MIRLVRPADAAKLDVAGNVEILRKALAEKGYEASTPDIEWAYQTWCDGACATLWLSTDDGDTAWLASQIIGSFVPDPNAKEEP